MRDVLDWLPLSQRINCRLQVEFLVPYSRISIKQHRALCDAAHAGTFNCNYNIAFFQEGLSRELVLVTT